MTNSKGERLHQVHIDAKMLRFELKLLVPNHKITELFRMVILDTYATDTAENKERKTVLAKELTEESNKLVRARELLLMGDIDGRDFKEIKSVCGKQKKMGKRFFEIFCPVKGGIWGSNPRPPEPQSGALTN